MSKFIVSVGDVVYGFVFFGPFDDAERAIDYANENSLDNWTVLQLNPPLRFEDEDQQA
jgi:hypothetical protein